LGIAVNSDKINCGPDTGSVEVLSAFILILYKYPFLKGNWIANAVPRLLALVVPGCDCK